MDELQYLVQVYTTISFGLMAGIYFIFSNTIMRALSNIPAVQASEAMVKINREILNPFFFVLFWGSCIGACFTIVTFISKGTSTLMLIAATIFLMGSTLVTLLINVPLNEKLAAMVYLNDNVMEFWKVYRKNWTRWNHVRTLCASIGFFLLVSS